MQGTTPTQPATAGSTSPAVTLPPAATPLVGSQGPTGPATPITSNQPTAQPAAISTSNQPTQQPSVGAAPTPIVVNVKQPATITDPNQPAATPLVVHVTQLPTPTAPPVMGRSIDVSAQPGTQINVDPNANQPTQQVSGPSVNSSNSITTQQTGTATNSTQSQLNITGPTQTRAPAEIQVTGDQSSTFKPVTVTNPNDPSSYSYAGWDGNVVQDPMVQQNQYNPNAQLFHVDPNAAVRQTQHNDGSSGE